jgi:peptidoglycan/xylan/chitin deacetylase (PgdA/CDA1 family)
MKVSAGQVLRNVNRSAYYIEKLLKVRPNFVHPPLGQTTRSAVRLLRHHGYHVIKWNTTLEKQGTKLPKYKDHGSAKKFSFIAYQHADKGTAKEERQVLKNIDKKDYEFVSLKQCLGNIKPYLDTHAAGYD